MIGEDLAQGMLEVVLGDYRPPEMAINAIYLLRKHLSAKVRSIVEYLTGYFVMFPR